MIVAQAFVSLSAALAGAVPAGQGSQQSQLGVTATVVRPAQFITLLSPVDSMVALIRNSASLDVTAEGGSVIRLDDETTVVTSGKPGSVTITLVF